MSNSRIRSMRVIIYSLAVVAVSLFFVLLTNSSKLGGGTLSGKVENGHYFVGNPRGYTEVTRQEYQTTKMLEIAVIIVWPIALFGLMYVERDRTNAFGQHLKRWLEKFARPKIRKTKLRKRKG